MKKRSNIKVRNILGCLVLAVPALVNAEVSWYGQLNRGALSVNDGHEKHTFFVDSAIDGSFAGIKGDASLDDSLKVGGQLEMAVVSGTSNGDKDKTVSQLNRTGSSNFLDVNYADTWIEGTFGTISIGKGDMASRNTGTVSLSDATIISYAGISDMAGGMYFHRKGSPARVEDGVDPQIGCDDGIFDAISGFGSKNRLRYDSPKFGNFVFSTSVGNQSEPNKYLSDLALTYENSVGDFNLKGAAAVGKTSKDSDVKAQKLYNASFAALHVKTGLNAAVSVGKQQNQVLAGNPVPEKKRNFYYVQFGKQADLIKYGKTNFVVDYFHAKHIAEVKDKARAYGIGLVQNLDKVNAAIYCGVRNYKYNKPTQQYNNIVAALVGIKINFAGKLQ